MCSQWTLCSLPRLLLCVLWIYWYIYLYVSQDAFLMFVHISLLTLLWYFLQPSTSVLPLCLFNQKFHSASWTSGFLCGNSLRYAVPWPVSWDISNFFYTVIPEVITCSHALGIFCDLHELISLVSVPVYPCLSHTIDYLAHFNFYAVKISPFKGRLWDRIIGKMASQRMNYLMNYLMTSFMSYPWNQRVMIIELFLINSNRMILYMYCIAQM